MTLWLNGLILTVIGTAVTALLGFLWQTTIGRSLGPQGFGELSSAAIVVALAASLASVGTGGFWLNIFGEKGVRALRWCKVTMQLVSLGTVIALAGVVLYSASALSSPTEVNLLYILLPLVPAQAAMDLAYAVAQLKRDYAKVALLQVSANALRFVALGIFVFVTGFTQLTVAGVAACMAIAAGACFLIASANLTQSRLKSLRGVRAMRVPDRSVSMLETPSARGVLTKSWPFAAVGLFYSIYYQIDIVMVSRIQGGQEAGLYSAGFVAMSAIYLIPAAVFQRLLLPAVQKWSFHNPHLYKRMFLHVSIAMFFAGIVAASLLCAFSDRIVGLCFGSEFQGTARLLDTLALAVPFHFASFSLGIVLASGKFIRRKLAIVAAGACLNVGLNLWLIPQFGGVGAAYATVATEVVVLLLLLVAGWRVVVPR